MSDAERIRKIFQGSAVSRLRAWASWTWSPWAPAPPVSRARTPRRPPWDLEGLEGRRPERWDQNAGGAAGWLLWRSMKLSCVFIYIYMYVYMYDTYIYIHIICIYIYICIRYIYIYTFIRYIYIYFSMPRWSLWFAFEQYHIITIPWPLQWVMIPVCTMSWSTILYTIEYIDCRRILVECLIVESWSMFDCRIFVEWAERLFNEPPVCSIMTLAARTFWRPQRLTVALPRPRRTEKEGRQSEGTGKDVQHDRCSWIWIVTAGLVSPGHSKIPKIATLLLDSQEN